MEEETITKQALYAHIEMRKRQLKQAQVHFENKGKYYLASECNAQAGELDYVKHMLLYNFTPKTN